MTVRGPKSLRGKKNVRGCVCLCAASKPTGQLQQAQYVFLFFFLTLVECFSRCFVLFTLLSAG